MAEIFDLASYRRGEASVEAELPDKADGKVIDLRDHSARGIGVCELSGHFVRDPFDISAQFPDVRFAFPYDDRTVAVYKNPENNGKGLWMPERFVLTYNQISHYRADFVVQRGIRARVLEVGIDGVGSFSLPFVDGEGCNVEDPHLFQRALHMMPENFPEDVVARLRGFEIASLRERVMHLCRDCVQKSFRPSVAGAFHTSLVHRGADVRDRFLNNPGHDKLQHDDINPVLRSALENVLATKKAFQEGLAVRGELEALKDLLVGEGGF